MEDGPRYSLRLWGVRLLTSGIAFLVLQLALPVAALVRARAAVESAMAGVFAAGLCIAVFESVLWSVGSIAAVPIWTAALCLLGAAQRAAAASASAARA